MKTGIPQYINMLKYEFILTVKTRLAYKSNLISNAVIAVLTFFLAYSLNQGTSLMNFYQTDDNGKNVLFLIGFLFWQVCMIALSYGVSTIEGEAERGTLEVKIQSVFPIPCLLFIKMVVSVLSNIFCYLVLIVLSIVFMHMSLQDSMFIIGSFVLMIPSLIGMFGLGLIFASFALREKNISQLMFIVQILLLVVSNVVSTGNEIVVMILPYSKGIEISRLLYLGKTVPLISTINYLLVNLVWLLIGTYIIKMVIRHERKFGSFSGY